ncbi:hypothetical protein ACHAW6_003131 [Cyclotella cf. meneghiniana]
MWNHRYELLILKPTPLISQSAMTKKSFLITSVLSVLLCRASADRYEAIEDAAPVDFEDFSSTSTTSSRSLYKSVTFILSWLTAIFVLRITVVIVGNIVNCLSGFFCKIKANIYSNGDRTPPRRAKRRYNSGSNSSYGSLGSLSEIMRFDDGASIATDSASGDSYTNYSHSTGWSEGGVIGDTSASVYSGDSGWNDKLFGGSRKQASDNKSQRDEEEGSHVSWFDSRTVSSIRSRFTNTSMRYDVIDDSRSGKPTKSDPLEKSRLESPQSLQIIQNDTNRTVDSESINTADRREQYNVQKQGLINKVRDGAPSRRQPGQTSLNDYLQKHERGNTTANSSFFGSKKSLVDVDLKSRKSRYSSEI